jgi:hypothetical protein
MKVGILALSPLDLAAANLTSIPVLVFLIAVVAATLKTDVRLPEPAYQAITIFLLLGIGIKGGHALKSVNLSQMFLPVLLTLLLGVLIPLIAYALLSASRRVSKVDRASLAAHYGSTSLVTFTAGLVMLESMKIFVEPYLAALLAIMEIPGIVVGIYLGLRAIKQGERTASQPTHGMRKTLVEVFSGKTVLLLVAGLLTGAIAPESSFAKVEPFFVLMQPGVLVLFLLQLGFIVGSRLNTLREAGVAIAAFGLTMPLIAGSIGAVLGSVVGLSVGGSTMLAILCASASYIAAPAAVGLALPKANLSISLTASLGITFPLNLIVGLPLYLELSRFMSTVLF